MTTAAATRSTKWERLDTFAPLFAPLDAPLGFEAGDANLYRYVGNHPSIGLDPFGLDDGWEWNWHHLLDKAIFDEKFMKRHGLTIDIHSAEYGWMLRAKDHTWKGGVHPKGWSKEWTKWVGRHESEGTKITKEMIDEQLQTMISKYKLGKAGFAARFGYKRAQDAWKAADRLFRRRAAQEALELAARTGCKAACEGAEDASKAGGKAAGELAEDATKAGSKAGSKARGILKGLSRFPLIGVVVGFVAGAAFGDDDALINAIEPIGFEPTVMGDAELRHDPDEEAYGLWQNYQIELNQQWAQRMQLGKMDTLSQGGARIDQCTPPTPVSYPTRSSAYQNR